MKRFDWQSFCTRYGIPYVERAAYVSKNNIGIHCPWCDPGRVHDEHMGLSLNVAKPSWGCWKCREAGNSPVRLISRLLRITAVKAFAIVDEANQPSADSFDGLLQDEPAPERTPRRLKLPQGCRPLAHGAPSARRFMDYLRDTRGFGSDVEALVTAYDLQYAMVGEQAWRVVYPVSDQGQLAAWTGRSIFGNARLRYKADEAGVLKHCLANQDELSSLTEPSSLILAIAEGPMDFLKLDLYGKAAGLRATCTFGTAWTQPQFARMVKLCKRFGQAIVVYDQSAYMEGIMLAEQLAQFTPHPVNAVQIEAKDPGEMSGTAIAGFARRVRSQSWSASLH